MTLLYILIALLVFGVLVMIHELGHFLVARAFGVGINEFSIGMGPKLFSKKGKKHDTVYSVRALPIGGYVSMVGEDEESDDPCAFGKKNVFFRILIVLAGPVMNILLGFLLMFFLVLGTDKLASAKIAKFQDDATSNAYGLMVGDEITYVEGVRVHTGNEVIYEIMNKGYHPLDITVKREGETLVLDDVMFPGMEEQGIAFGSPDFVVFAEAKNFGTVMKHTFFRSLSTVKMIYDQILDLLRGRFGFNALSGPVGVTEAMGEAAKVGASNFFYLVTVITMNLGVFNLLPIPALDGGRLFFLIIEAVTRRPINKKVEGYIHFAGLMLLFALMIVVSCKDIAGLFK